MTAWTTMGSQSAVRLLPGPAAPPPSPSRLRKGFVALLKLMPEEALWAELEEWMEEEARAHEHCEAVRAELAQRGKNADEN